LKAGATIETPIVLFDFINTSVFKKALFA
jgi:hypothetical protein